jgi:hypothetical protein
MQKGDTFDCLDAIKHAVEKIAEENIFRVKIKRTTKRSIEDDYFSTIEYICEKSGKSVKESSPMTGCPCALKFR